RVIPKEAVVPQEEILNARDGMILDNVMVKPASPWTLVAASMLCLFMNVLLILERESLVNDEPIHYTTVLTYTFHFLQHFSSILALLFVCIFQIHDTQYTQIKR